MKRLVFVGDSITFGCNWSELLGSSNIVNQGIPGDTTRDVLARLDRVTDPEAGAYFIMAGINDLPRGISRDETISNVRKIILKLRQLNPDADMVLQSILPVNSRIRPFVFETSLVKVLNDGLREIADAKSRVFFLDLYPAFLDEDGRLKAEYTDDGLHINAAGYEVWAEFLRKEWITR